MNSQKIRSLFFSFVSRIFKAILSLMLIFLLLVVKILLFSCMYGYIEKIKLPADKSGVYEAPESRRRVRDCEYWTIYFNGKKYKNIPYFDYVEKGWHIYDDADKTILITPKWRDVPLLSYKFFYSNDEETLLHKYFLDPYAVFILDDNTFDDRKEADYIYIWTYGKDIQIENSNLVKTFAENPDKLVSMLQKNEDLKKILKEEDKKGVYVRWLQYNNPLYYEKYIDLIDTVQ